MKQQKKEKERKEIEEILNEIPKRKKFMEDELNKKTITDQKIKKIMKYEIYCYIVEDSKKKIEMKQSTTSKHNEKHHKEIKNQIIHDN